MKSDGISSSLYVMASPLDKYPRACAARFTLGYNLAGFQPLGGARSVGGVPPCLVFFPFAWFA